MNATLLNFLINKYGVNFFFVVDINGDNSPDAYIFAGKEDGISLHIFSIAVLEPFEGRGWGSKLMKYLISKGKLNGIKLLKLHVETTNERAKRLYRKFGFKKIGTSSNYYGPKRDATVMNAEIYD